MSEENLSPQDEQLTNQIAKANAAFFPPDLLPDVAGAIEDAADEETDSRGRAIGKATADKIRKEIPRKR